MPAQVRHKPHGGTASPHQQLKNARLQQNSSQLKWVASFAAVLFVAISIAWISSFLGSRAAGRPRNRLQPIGSYGLVSGQLPLSKDVTSAPCPISDRSGSKLDCFFSDIYSELAEHEQLGHGDSSLGFQGTYGEITPEGVRMILDFLHVDSNDSFYDLGSGTGKVVLQAFLTTPCQRAVGIELSEPRHLTAARARTRILDVFGAHSQSSRLHFQQGDASKASIEDATIIFMCSLCFPDIVMRKIARHLGAAAKPGTVVLSLKAFEDYPGMTLIGHIPLPMTWTSSFEMLVYVVAPSMGTMTSLLGAQSFGSLRNMLRANVREGFDQTITNSIIARSRLDDATGLDDDRISSAVGQFLSSVADAHAWSVDVLQRYFTIAAAHEVGRSSDRTSLTFSKRVKDRARQLVLNGFTSGKQPKVRAKDFASFVLSRVQGDDASIADAIVADLWPNSLPKLKPEEMKDAFGQASWQSQMTSGQLHMMLDLIEPPLGPADVLVEAFSGAGQLIIQARLTTDAGRTVGIEAVQSRHDAALDAQRMLRACEHPDSDDFLSCPLALSALLSAGLHGSHPVLHASELGLIRSGDPIEAAVAVPGTSVIYSLSQGLPRKAMWRLATKASLAMPIGGVIIVTSLWAGCQRGLLEVLAAELAAPRSAGDRFMMPWSTSVNLVLPVADAAHPLFSSASDVSEQLKDLMLQRLGLSEKLRTKGRNWRKHTIPFAEVVALLVNFGPPFLEQRSVPPVDASLVQSRFEAMFRRYLKEESDRRAKQSHDNTLESVSLELLLSVLLVALQGGAQTPFECLASDLDVLLERDDPNGGGSGAVEMSTLTSAGESYKACMETGELRPVSIATLLEYPLLHGRFDADSAALVVGDCHAASLMLLTPNGPKNVRCLSLSGPALDYDTSLAELNASLPQLLHDRHFEASSLDVARRQGHRLGVGRLRISSILLLAQCGDRAAAQRLATDVLTILAPGPETLMVSLVELDGTSELDAALPLPLGWMRHPDLSDVSAHFYEFAAAA